MGRRLSRPRGLRRVSAVTYLKGRLKMDWNPINENDRRINNIANVLAMTPYDEGGSLKDSVVDLLADLRHFCRGVH